MIRITTVLLLTLTICLSWVARAAEKSRVQGQVGLVSAAALSEISGLVLSPTQPEILWVINDSGNAPCLHALNRNGQVLASVPVSGVSNRDWEDLAAYSADGRGYLVIGEVGDNRARHAYSALYIVAEPRLEETASAPLERAIYFRYPDGPRDAESIAVDAVSGRVLVLSKRTAPPVLYAVPLDARTATPSEAVTATRLAIVDSIPPPTAYDVAIDPATGIYASQPTAMDWSERHGLAVMTYARPYLWLREAGESLDELLMREPVALVAPRLQQSEAITFDGDTVLLTSEGVPAPLVQLELPR